MQALSLTYDIVPVASLRHGDRDDLWDVYRRHFDAARSELDASLARGSHVIRYRRRGDQRARGLTVISLREAEHAGRRFHWLWAGALAIDRECRGRGLIERSGIETFARFRVRHPSAPLFWLYESISFQSFRMMARSFDVYWPRPDHDTPAWEHGAIDTLARISTGDRWDPERRIVRATGRKHIRHESSQTSVGEDDPLRAFYRRINPGAENGAAVVMLAPLDATNLRAVLRHALSARRT
ncbi:hypothetical protein [Sandaracinus amylolyticus]|uniref:N-acetyltransferase domain-containing protein n=1 Tax=Sandaracinus amylolyticus TaxID=927083 RepID=A0A0F6W729_9BACT|nr:hypothetical protein [Sandaracinus amylolyticus]AKF09086.1 hypothetical protein DB32_006235 [Sandaracinus amylolyticus]